MGAVSMNGGIWRICESSSWTLVPRRVRQGLHTLGGDCRKQLFRFSGDEWNVGIKAANPDYSRRGVKKLVSVN